jgi:hypothetical protein
MSLEVKGRHMWETSKDLESDDEYTTKEDEA